VVDFGTVAYAGDEVVACMGRGGKRLMRGGGGGEGRLTRCLLLDMVPVRRGDLDL
jgi:hypothetical protein